MANDIDLFTEKINLLMVSLPSDYRNMFENLLTTHKQVVSEKQKSFNQYWADIVSGKEKYVVLPNMEKGKGYKLCAIISDIPSKDTIVTEVSI